MAGVYIHVPFCQTKCRYCDFYSVTNIRQRDGFVKALLVELDKRKYELQDRTVETVYLGGGTPSLLDRTHISAILQAVRATYEVLPDAEITLECNPGDLSEMDIRYIVSSGVNRISIGAQSFQSGILSFLTRRHDAEETKAMFSAFREAGVTNISMDLIYGIPGTTLDTLALDLSELLSLGPEHVSAYHLIYEEGTPLWQDLIDGRVAEVDEETSLQMSHLVRSTLTRYGYEHYEISNYARPGYRSRHNSSYWTGTPYLGFGPSAHSYVHPWRSSNTADLDLYCSQLLNGAHFLDRRYERITPRLAYEEYILTRLRTSDGLDLDDIMVRFGDEYHTIAHQIAEQYRLEGHLSRNGVKYALTESGIDISDRIMASFF